jgi:hypothetical protein
MRKGLRVAKPVVPVGQPNTRAEWEAKLVAEATYFTCSIPMTGHRQRGERLQWNVANHPTLLAAVQAASVNPRALVYAVNAKGDSCPLSRADWPRYLQLRGEQ